MLHEFLEHSQCMARVWLGGPACPLCVSGLPGIRKEMRGERMLPCTDIPPLPAFLPVLTFCYFLNIFFCFFFFLEEVYSF